MRAQREIWSNGALYMGITRRSINTSVQMCTWSSGGRWGKSVKVRIDAAEGGLEMTDGSGGGDVAWLNVLDLAVCIDMFQGR